MDFVFNSKMWRGLMKRLVLAGLLALLCLQAGAAEKGTFYLGAHSGWSVGFKPEFDWHYAGATSHNYTPDYHVAGYLRYNVSDRFGLQLSMDHQHGAYDILYRHSPDSGGFSIVSYNLNGVFDYAGLKNGSLYLLAGIGLGNADNTYHFDDSFFVLTGGTGIRIHARRSAATAFILGAAWQHLWDASKEYSDHHADLLRFHVGFEFAPNLRRD